MFRFYESSFFFLLFRAGAVSYIVASFGSCIQKNSAQAVCLCRSLYAEHLATSRKLQSGVL